VEGKLVEVVETVVVEGKLVEVVETVVVEGKLVEVVETKTETVEVELNSTVASLSLTFGSSFCPVGSKLPPQL
jgi:hypothetical protein